MPHMFHDDESTSEMADRYGDWLLLNGLPRDAEAMELLNSYIVTSAQRAWLGDFCAAWREAEDREGFPGRSPADNDVDSLSETFVAIVNRDLSEHLVEINRRNTTQDGTGACATHDFCDANLLMHEAFVATMGREPDSASDADAELWGAAWYAAKASRFVL
jgi:hypothetical protein